MAIFASYGIRSSELPFLHRRTRLGKSSCPTLHSMGKQSKRPSERTSRLTSWKRLTFEGFFREPQIWTRRRRCSELIPRRCIGKGNGCSLIRILEEQNRLQTRAPTRTLIPLHVAGMGGGLAKCYV